MFSVSVKDMKLTESSMHMLNPISVEALQRRLEVNHELIITREGLSEQQIKDKQWRVASFDCDDSGSTYFIGSHQELEDYVFKLTNRSR